jgi:purine-binding chemotaxis protein CheW
MQTIADNSQTSQYLTFFLAGEEYAVGILQVHEILEVDAITRIPSSPPWIRGVINLRGSVVPVVDLALKLGLPETAVTRHTCIVILDAEVSGQRMVLGALTDSVNQVIDLGSADIQPPPSFGAPVHPGCLVGMAQAGHKFILLLDVDRVLSAEQMFQVESALSRMPGEAEAGAEGEAVS